MNKIQRLEETLRPFCQRCDIRRATSDGEHGVVVGMLLTFGVLSDDSKQLVQEIREAVAECGATVRFQRDSFGRAEELMAKL
mgnify:CR=1 FL=1